MPHAVLCGEFLLHTPCCFMWGVSLTHSVLFYVLRLSYMPHAILCREFLLHGQYCFMWGISLTHSVLFYVGGFSYITVAFFMQEVCFPCPMLFDIRNLSYTPYASLCGGDFLIICSVFFRLKSFFYTLHAVLCGKFLLQFYVPCTSIFCGFLLHTPC